MLLVLAALLLLLSRPKENLASSITHNPIVSATDTLSIPAINLQTEVIPTGLNRENLQEVPNEIVGLYQPGPKPGERGNVVLVGHTPGIFTNLTRLKIGDIILAGGFSYQINKIVVYETASFPVKEIYGPGNGFNLNIITCHGASERLVIFSNRILTDS